MSLNSDWCAAKYGKKGHFIWHCDAERPIPGTIHIGTQIILPPSKLCSYLGG